jgi:hypothetical protein
MHNAKCIMQAVICEKYDYILLLILFYYHYVIILLCYYDITISLYTHKVCRKWNV